jgi:hypothetical protein
MNVQQLKMYLHLKLLLAIPSQLPMVVLESGDDCTQEVLKKTTEKKCRKKIKLKQKTFHTGRKATRSYLPQSIDFENLNQGRGNPWKSNWMHKMNKFLANSNIIKDFLILKFFFNFLLLFK